MMNNKFTNKSEYLTLDRDMFGRRIVVCKPAIALEIVYIKLVVLNFFFRVKDSARLDSNADST